MKGLPAPKKPVTVPELKFCQSLFSLPRISSFQGTRTLLIAAVLGPGNFASGWKYKLYSTFVIADNGIYNYQLLLYLMFSIFYNKRHWRLKLLKAATCSCPQEERLKGPWRRYREDAREKHDFVFNRLSAVHSLYLVSLKLIRGLFKGTEKPCEAYHMTF